MDVGCQYASFGIGSQWELVGWKIKKEEEKLRNILQMDDTGDIGDVAESVHCDERNLVDLWKTVERIQENRMLTVRLH